MKESERGFTLIELIITVALMAIVGTIALPFFQGIAANGNLKAAAANLASDFSLSRQRALAENTMYRITVADTQNYSVEQCTNIGSACIDWNPIQTKNLGEFASDITFTSAGATYVVQPRGIITPAGNIGLANGRGSTAALNIMPAGRTSVSFALH